MKHLLLKFILGLALVVAPSSLGQDVLLAFYQDHHREPAVVGGSVHDGVELMVDLPIAQHVKNFGAPSDSKGLCVFASIDMMARWHHEASLIDIIHKMSTGGGWPEKVDKTIKAMSPATQYQQYEGTNPAMLDFSLNRRSPACVTIGYGERYGPITIYHMVLLVHFDDKYACIIDNNFPETYEWMSREEFLRRWVFPSNKGWAITFMSAPPPPIPRNLKDSPQ